MMTLAATLPRNKWRQRRCHGERWQVTAARSSLYDYFEFLELLAVGRFATRWYGARNDSGLEGPVQALHLVKGDSHRVRLLMLGKGFGRWLIGGHSASEGDQYVGR